MKYIDRWFAFARQLELGIEQMEELILVTGCDRARSWTNVAFLKNQLDAEVSFGVEVTHSLEGRINWQVSPERIRGAVLNKGPNGKVRSPTVRVPFSGANEPFATMFLCLLEPTRKSMHIHPRFSCCSYPWDISKTS